MSKSVSSEILPEQLAEHRAVRAWSRLEPEQVEPERIEVLKLKNKSAVYRLAGVGSDGSDIIAKRCRATTGLIERLIHREFLAHLALPALRYYGFVEEAGGEFGWLFLERARGTEYSSGNSEHRALAGGDGESLQASGV